MIIDKDGFVQVATCIIYNTQGLILIGQRKHGSHQGGKWEFPGGKLEQGEDVLTAAYRELNEELGIHPLNLRFLGLAPSLQAIFGEKKFLLNLVEFQLNSKNSILTYHPEHEKLAWVTSDQITQYDLLKTNLPIVDYIKAKEKTK